VGFVCVNVVVRGVKSSKSVRMLVDASSTYIVLRPDLIRELGHYETPYAVEVTLANGRRVKTRLFLAEVEVKGRRGPALVAELLGVYALETLGFKVNPRTGEVEEISPEGGYLL